MLRGIVNALQEAVVSLKIRGPGGAEVQADAVIDTGFTGALSIPPSIITSLKLVTAMKNNLVLADGTVRSFDYYAVQVFWNGTWKQVLASALGDDTLIGMTLLADHALMIEVKPSGSVVIDKLP
jgi:clan AA aspartic protease